MLDVFPVSARVQSAELELGGVTASALAEQFGTPLVVYCEETLVVRARSLLEAVGAGGRVFYGTKAFANVAVLGLLRGEGIGADVASEGELAFARAAGLSGDELVVHGNNKSEAFLRAAATHSAPVVLDAPDEAELAAAAGVARVLVRVTLGVDADTHEAVVTGHHGSKFGLPPDEAQALIADALGRGLGVLGLHVHVGSQLPDFTAQAATIERLAAFAAACRDALGWEPRIADLGGGFGIPHRPEDDVPDAADLAAAAAASVRAAFASAELAEPEVWLEPGRSLVGRAGVTLYRAGAVKRLSDRTWVAVDGGMSDNLRPMLYGAYHRIEHVESVDRPSAVCDIVGPICETTDTLGKDRTMPRPEVGDLMAVFDAGAYGAVMASNYNRRPMPAEVLVENGEPVVIKRRQTIDDLMALES